MATKVTKRKYYAVAAGYEPGIYRTWAECEIQVRGYKGQKYKSFPTEVEALRYLEVEGSRAPSSGDSIRPELSSTSKSSLSIKPKSGDLLRKNLSENSLSQRAQVASVSNPFKNYAFQTSSSVLEMAPADYEGLFVEPSATELNQNQVTQATPRQLPTHLNDDLGSVSDVNVLYQLEYDGASKGNPGAAGAGALLRHPDGTVVCEMSVGLGKATNNVAEYRGLIVGMRKALELGIQRVQAQGDSKLVTMQVRGKWKINNANLAILCKEATELLKNFKEFQIRHVDREYNSAADLLANKGVSLCEEKFVSSFTVNP